MDRIGSQECFIWGMNSELKRHPSYRPGMQVIPHPDGGDPRFWTAYDLLNAERREKGGILCELFAKIERDHRLDF